VKVLLAALAVAAVLPATVLAQSTDMRAPDQQAPAAQAAPATDQRAPDQQAPATQTVPATDQRAPDQQAPATQPAPATDLRAPDQQAPVGGAAPNVPAIASDGGPNVLMVVLIAVGAALVLAGGGYRMFRHHRAGAHDDLVVQ
jgi:hypothetical protein